MSVTERRLADVHDVRAVGAGPAGDRVVPIGERRATSAPSPDRAPAPERRERVVALAVFAERASHPTLPAHALARVLDLLDEGVLLLRGSDTLYLNVAATRLLAREGDVLARDARRLAHAAELAATATAIEIPEAAGRYVLRAVPLAGLADDARPAVLVIIDRASPSLPSSSALRRRFGLTTREASVALLVTQGLQNADVARALGIRANTARHYTESVFAKLAVHSRAALAATVLGAAHRRG